VAITETIHPHIDAAYRRVNALQSQRCARRGMAEFIALLPLPAIVVDWQLTPLFHNTAGQEAAVRWTGADSCLKSPASEFGVAGSAWNHRRDEGCLDYRAARRLRPVAVGAR